MLSVCLIFLYVMLTAYVTGFSILSCISRFVTGKSETEAPSPFWPALRTDGYVMAGLVGLTVYAQFFSLFYKVGLAANILLLLICAACVIFFRSQLKAEAERIREKLTIGRSVFYLFLFLLFAYGTSQGVIHYDTGLYHAQSIRWIEEYGVVKGLGNLHSRLAYNSSSFSLSALFSFAFLGIQSFHCMAGFFALLLAKVCGEIGTAWRRKRLKLSDLVRVMCLYYLLIIFDEIVSPASDYFTVLTVFYIIIRWLDLLEWGEKSYAPYGLLCLAGVFTMSLKLSAALILLLALKPAVMLLRDKNWKAIFTFIFLGLLVIAPYLIRNALLSGWLVYPFTSVDLIAADWKIPKEIADYDAKEIQVWGRGIHDVARFEEPVTSWFPGWFSALGAVDRLFTAAGIGAVLALPVAAAAAFIRRKRERYDRLLVAAAVDVSFLFWLFSAPLIRYGCVYVWLAATVTFGGALLPAMKNRLLRSAVYAVSGIIVCYKLFAFGRELVTAYDGQYFICQKEYENYDTEPYQIEGIIFYCPAEGDRTGYDAFPAAPFVPRIALRGMDISEGFIYK